MTAASPQPDAEAPDGRTSADATTVTGGEDVHTEEPAPPVIPDYVFDIADVPVATAILDEAFADLHDGPVGWGLVEAAVADHEGLDPSLVRELSLIASRDLRLAGGGNRL